MQWDSYSAREHEGRRYGMKSDSFGPYLDLPKRCRTTFELAIGSPSAPRELLRERGWQVVDPLEATRDPWTYQRYLRNSRAEFGVAKHGYVVAATGWFSERSACYLASGRPILVQDTGFTDWLSTTGGVVPFRTVEEAIDGIERIECRYDFHAREARNLAIDVFDSDKVLFRLIERAMCAAK
jgi:hypothetical protein